MIKRIIFLLLCFCCMGSLRATHIVGGEIEMKHISGNQYDFNLILYFDAVNGNPGAMDNWVTIYIYSKSGNRLMDTLLLPRTSNTPVNYTSPACAIGRLVTRRLFYTASLTMNPTRYSDPAGYYAVWERCCRNNIISNIVNPQGAGQTFILEFPPLMRNGQRFINSSPQVFPPLSDYACANQMFYVDFRGSDLDGDSLVYSMVTPLNGSSSQTVPLPRPSPQPHRDITWRPGFSANNAIPGQPSLRITRDGMMSVNASSTGLFVFSVLVEEFRRGQKIGQVRRDFQMLVIDCPKATPPKAQLQLPGSNTVYNEKDTIFISALDPNKCTSLQVTDADPRTVVKGRIRPVNFDQSLANTIFPPQQGNLNSPTQVVNMQVCFPSCPASRPEGYIMDLIIEDNSCSVPLMDTVRVLLKIIPPPPNRMPTITPSLPVNAQGEYVAEVLLGQSISFLVTGNDADKQRISMSATAVGFNMASLGMSFPSRSGDPPLTQAFTWRPPCNALAPGEDSREYLVNLNISDQPLCEKGLTSSSRLRLTVRRDVSENLRPQTTTPLTYDPVTRMYYDTIFVGESLTFDVKGNDPENDSIRLVMDAPAGLGMQFAPRSGRPVLTSPFSWRPLCTHLDPVKDAAGKTFDLRFITSDFIPCRTGSSDTARVRLLVLPRPNLKPKVTTSLRYDAVRKLYFDTVVVGRQVAFTVTGDDPEKDSVLLAMRGLGINPAALGMSFRNLTGIAPQTGPFRWRPLCGTLSDSTKPQNFDLEFIVNDFDFCGQKKYDTTRVRLTVIPDPKPNPRPLVSTTLNYNAQHRMYIDTVDIGRLVLFDVIGSDADLDSVLLQGRGIGFNFADVGMRFSSKSGIAPVRSPFSWATSCDLLNIRGGVFSREFLMEFTVKDFKECKASLSDTTRVKLVLRYKPQANVAPVLTAHLTPLPLPKAYSIDVRAGDSVNFRLLAEDADGDSVLITASGKGFTLASQNMRFVSAKGIAPQQGRFSWLSNCQALAAGGNPKSYEVVFRVRDFNGCSDVLYDSITVTIRVLPPPNPNPPVISTNLQFDPGKRWYFQEVRPGGTVSFEIRGTDADNDVITISGRGVGFAFTDYKMVFSPLTGRAPQTALFNWQPDCDMLRAKKEYDLIFTVRDSNPCNITYSDSLNVRLMIKDVENTGDFIPYNVFTPNGDGLNDTFSMPDKLPVDNCQDQFAKIEIYNRWGKKVFVSADRNFSWDGKGFPTGAYYYTIFYKNSQYKGMISIIAN